MHKLKMQILYSPISHILSIVLTFCFPENSFRIKIWAFIDGLYCPKGADTSFVICRTLLLLYPKYV